jgi:hypothetical protein
MARQTAPTTAVRTAKEVIDQAINDNRFDKWILYGFAVAFGGIGMTVLLWSVWKGEAVAAVCGGLTTGLFWPAARMAERIRKQNLAIRLMEQPLSKAETADEVARGTATVLHRGVRSQCHVARGCHVQLVSAPSYG